MPQHHSPAGFIAVGNGIHMSCPPSGTVTLKSDDSAPNVIIIFGWMGALTRHLERYAHKYAELYPNATRIIVKCEPSFFWTSESKRQNLLMPVLSALESLGCLASNDKSNRSSPRVLVHSFSNGGGSQMMSLGSLLAAKYPSLPPLERSVNALVLDSSPSSGSFRSIGKAFSVAIRDPVSRWIALPIIYVVYAFSLLLQMVFGWEPGRTRYYKTLLQPHLLPWMSMQTPRLYIFSKRDDMVSWKDVQRHAETAKASGLIVRCEIYQESGHVAHMRLDPNRYWGSIQDIWQIACREHQAGAIDFA